MDFLFDAIVQWINGIRTAYIQSLDSPPSSISMLHWNSIHDHASPNKRDRHWATQRHRYQIHVNIHIVLHLASVSIDMMHVRMYILNEATIVRLLLDFTISICIRFANLLRIVCIEQKRRGKQLVWQALEWIRRMAIAQYSVRRRVTARKKSNTALIEYRLWQIPMKAKKSIKRVIDYPIKSFRVPHHRHTGFFV